MRRVAIFGNAGGGKSTLAKRLASMTGLPLHPLDMIKFKPGGEPVPHADYVAIHAELLGEDHWIIDGFGDVATAWERFARADTLIFVDQPISRHVWWVTKRHFKGLFKTPEGWPDDSPMWRSTFSSYKVLWLCHRRLTPRYRQLVVEASATKRVHHLRSPRDISNFLEAVARETKGA